jgi:hypothetical protein
LSQDEWNVDQKARKANILEARTRSILRMKLRINESGRKEKQKK